MGKTWNVISWVLIVAAQVALGYSLVALFYVINSISQPATLIQFLLIPLYIWLGYLVGVYGVGMLGLALKKLKPYKPGLRLLTTAGMTILPVLILIFNAYTVGLENQQEFHDLVLVRMVPYYTQLCAVFSLLGFYITVWWGRALNRSTGR